MIGLHILVKEIQTGTLFLQKIHAGHKPNLNKVILQDIRSVDILLNYVIINKA